MSRKGAGLVILMALVLFCFASCQQDRQPCEEPKLVSLIFGAYYAFDTTGVVINTPVLLPSPVIGPVSIRSAGPIYSGIISSAQSFSLLLSTTADSCQYYLKPDSTFSNFDTLSFYYQRQLTFLSNACGFAYYFSLQRVNTTFYNIDSVILENPAVTNNVNVEHLKIYFRNL